ALSPESLPKKLEVIVAAHTSYYKIPSHLIYVIIFKVYLDNYLSNFSSNEAKEPNLIKF
ncbi:6728_t:CDS:1, partial [Funneliformis mosseae]